MTIYYYLSIMPEALIASMLPPKEFGTYFAIGKQKQASGQAIFFQLDGKRIESEYFNLQGIEDKCGPHPDGTPKNTSYISIYRVLEHLPLECVGDLFLVTQDARILKISQSAELPAATPGIHLYQEMCPVHPRVASSLGPKEFCEALCRENHPIHLPRILFADLRIGELADNPGSGSARDLPYHAIMHLRECLKSVKEHPEGKNTKTVDRLPTRKFPFRMIRTGFYLGDASNLLFYPFPTDRELEEKYHFWWRSASL